MLAEVLVQEIVRICRDRLHIPFLRQCRGVVTAFDSASGACSVRTWWGTTSKVRTMQPWPGCEVVFFAGADVLVSWPSGEKEENGPGSSELPVIVGFYSGAAVSIKILPGGAAAVRVGDSTQVNVVSDPAFIAWMAAVHTVCTAAAGLTGTPFTVDLPTTVDGKAISGSPKVTIG